MGKTLGEYLGNGGAEGVIFKSSIYITNERHEFYIFNSLNGKWLSVHPVDFCGDDYLIRDSVDVPYWQRSSDECIGCLE